MSVPLQCIFLFNEPRILSVFVNLFQTLVKKGKTSVLVRGEGPLLDEPTERLSLHQLCVELVVVPVSTLQECFVYKTNIL